MRYPPQTFCVPLFNNSPWSANDSQSGYVELDGAGQLDNQIPDSSTPTTLTSVSVPDSRRPSMVKVEDEFSVAGPHMWHERPQGPVLAGPVRNFSHPPMPQLNTNARPHEFTYAPTYTSAPNWPLSTHSDPAGVTPVFGSMHDGFNQPPHFPIGGPITFGNFTTDPLSAITMSPQSSQSGWCSGASSDGTERPMTLQSPLGRAPSPTSIMRPDGIRKKNARFEIPKDRNLNNIDDLIMRSTNEHEKKELKQQKRLLRNRQAALDSRQRKKTHTERLEQEKKDFISKESEMQDRLSQQLMGFAQEREEWVHQRQEMDSYIRNLIMERDNAIQERTLETGDLRRQINYLKDMIRDQQRQVPRGHMSQSTDSFTNDFHHFSTLGIDDSWEEGEYGFISRDEMRLDGGDPFHRQATPRPVSAPAATTTDTDSHDAKPEAGFSWNTFYMCLLFGAFIAANSGTKPGAGAVSTTITTPAIPALSDDYRTEAGNVLKAVLGSTSTNGDGAIDSDAFPLGMVGEFSDHTVGIGQSRLDALHASLTSPTRHQQRVAAFGLSAASYNHITNPDDIYDTDPSLDDFIEHKPTQLEQMVATMQAERDGIDKMTGLGSRARERSVLLGNVPEKVLREFRALVGMTEQMNLQ